MSVAELADDLSSRSHDTAWYGRLLGAARVFIVFYFSSSCTSFFLGMHEAIGHRRLFNVGMLLAMLCLLNALLRVANTRSLVGYLLASRGVTTTP